MSDGFTKEQESLIEQVAWRVGESLRAQFELRVAEKIELHKATCITTQMVRDALARAKGGWTAIATICSVIAAIVAIVMSMLALQK